MVLITTILLLVVVTLLALAMLRGVGLETRIAGNVMDKQARCRLPPAARPMPSNGWSATDTFIDRVLVDDVHYDCIAGDLLQHPRHIHRRPVRCGRTVEHRRRAIGYSYNPISGTSNLFSTSGGANSYAAAPTVYIADLGTDATYANAIDYQVDAWSYGGGTATIAVVESTYQIRYTATGGGGP